jgi:hypothetical protein
MKSFLEYSYVSFFTQHEITAADEKTSHDELPNESSMRTQGYSLDSDSRMNE